MRHNLIPGLNVDALDISAGMRELVECGYPSTEANIHMVVHYALQRWARGEEEAAERGAINRDGTLCGIDLTSWRRVLAAAMAGAQTLKAEKSA